MLNRRQQWRRAVPRTRSNNFLSQLEADSGGNIRPSLSAPELSAPPGRRRAGSAPEVVRIGTYQAPSALRVRSTTVDCDLENELAHRSVTGFRSLFPTVVPANRTRKRVSWHGRISVRQIPVAREMPHEYRRDIWWDVNDLQSFAAAELKRLMCEGSINSLGVSPDNGSPPASGVLLPPAKSI
mmetsp:Transcript_98134/g.280880  ORF Transcript_98134/g.280880 Transcript_98134/m.280880 type:complete len:183 (+) Transcript_98134:304-852(+)